MPRIPNEPAYGVQAGKPDFGGLGKGVWNVPYIVNLQTDAHDENGCRFIQVPFKPAAKAVWEERYLKNDMKDDPEGFCLPPGIPRMMYTPYPAQIYQMPDRIVMVYEGAAHVWRLIWMDGRPLPKSIDDINPDFLGYSVGRWEGDTLVVESMGFNTETWLDASGHPHGENMRVTEKYTRTSFNNIKLEATINDPGVLHQALDHRHRDHLERQHSRSLDSPGRRIGRIHLPGEQPRSEPPRSGTRQVGSLQLFAVSHRLAPAYGGARRLFL